MIFNIVTIVAIIHLTVSAGDLVVDLHRSPSNQPLSSMIFNREDIPISYHHADISITTPKTTFLHYRPSTESSVQYAPLDHGKEKVNNLMLHSPHNLISASEKPEQLKMDRKPLEPLLEPEIRTHMVHPNPMYIPGHNVEVLRSVNRVSGYNAVYKKEAHSDNIGFPVNKKHKKVNFLNRYNIRVDPWDMEIRRWSSTEKLSTITSSTITPTTSTTTTIPSLPQLYNLIQKPFYAPYEVPANLLAQQQLKSPYQMHTLLVNVARGYNIPLAPRYAETGASPTLLIQMPAKKMSPLNLMKYSKNSMNVPSFFPSLIQANEQKTLAYPVPLLKSIN